MTLARFRVTAVAAAVSLSMTPKQRTLRKTNRCPWPRPEGWPTYKPTRVYDGDHDLGWRAPTDSRLILPERRDTVEVDGLREPRALNELNDHEHRLFYLQLAAWRAALIVESMQESRRLAAQAHADADGLRGYDITIRDAWDAYRKADDRWRTALVEHQRGFHAR